MIVIGCRKECHNLGSRVGVEAEVPREWGGGGRGSSLHHTTDFAFGPAVVLKTKI